MESAGKTWGYHVRAEGEPGMDIYMYMPKGMEPTAEEHGNGGVNAVLKLLRSLYGLKQAGRLCMERPVAQEIGFRQCKTDLCLYYKRIDQDILILVRFMSMISFLSTATLVDKFFEDLRVLEVKDLGTVTNFSVFALNCKTTTVILSNST
jgi:hypothetical protein